MLSDLTRGQHSQAQVASLQFQAENVNCPGPLLRPGEVVRDPRMKDAGADRVGFQIGQ